MVGRQAGIGQRRRLDRVEPEQRHEVAGVVDDHELRHRPRCAQAGRTDAELTGALAVLLGPGLAGATAPTAPSSEDRHLVADGETAGIGAERLDDTGTFVPEREREADP